MEVSRVGVEVLRPVDFDLAFGVNGDMREQGWEKDQWPELYREVQQPTFWELRSGDEKPALPTPPHSDKGSICDIMIERVTPGRNMHRTPYDSG